MQWRGWWVPALLAMLWCAAPAHAETVHLNTGESIKGKIVRTDDESVSIESERGFGVIQIKRSDITLIEYDESARDPSRLVGIGYYHRATPSTVPDKVAEYGVDSLSLKMWLNDVSSVDLQLGYYGADNAEGTQYELFSLDLRYAHVFKRQASVDVYWGGSVGYISVTDKTSSNKAENTGYTGRLFLGLEFFFVTLPNVGISSEISIGTQSIGDNTTTNLSTSTFPAFSIRYYF